ncbi:MAG: cell division topological specificity factor MinE [Desulfobacteraceae bacterium]|nr:cell division topological specificity factor MinE [Desulfobacteraceae bacterium]MBC2757802.1 cell division topological specificity factor MinE [Desulfobacteraceae bacterium]
MNFNTLLKKLMNKSDSKDIAKKRLKFALLTDKLEIKTDTLGNLQKDLVEVISRYFEIDNESIKIDIQRSEECSALIFNTPIISAHRQMGIPAA